MGYAISDKNVYEHIIMKSPEHISTYYISDQRVYGYKDREFEEFRIWGRYWGYDVLGLTDLLDRSRKVGLAPVEFAGYERRPLVKAHERWHHWAPPEKKHDEEFVHYKAKQSELSRN